MGLCGILAHRLGNENTTVVLTDGDTDALVQLRQNVTLNSTGHSEMISCRQLLWGESNAHAFIRQQQGQQPFDVILASDVIYVPEVVDPLFATVQTCLRRRTGKFLLAYKQRDLPVTNTMVLRAAERAGLHWYEQSVSQEGMYLYEFRLRGDSSDTEAVNDFPEHHSGS